MEAHNCLYFVGGVCRSPWRCVHQDGPGTCKKNGFLGWDSLGPKRARGYNVFEDRAAGASKAAEAMGEDRE